MVSSVFFFTCKITLPFDLECSLSKVHMFSRKVLVILFFHWHIFLKMEFKYLVSNAIGVII